MPTRTRALHDYTQTIRRSLINGTITLFILHRAQYESVYGGALTKALRALGYSMSPGTLYPLLHTLEQEKLLQSRTTTVRRRVRRYYDITPFGRDCHREARPLLATLAREILSDHDTHPR